MTNYQIGRYNMSELPAISKWWQMHREYDINEYREPREYDDSGNEIQREYKDYVEIVPRAPELIAQDQIATLKSELSKIKEDIEQETFGLVRDDFAEKKVRAAEIINELRVLEGKTPRKVSYI